MKIWLCTKTSAEKLRPDDLIKSEQELEAKQIPHSFKPKNKLLYLVYADSVNSDERCVHNKYHHKIGEYFGWQELWLHWLAYVYNQRMWNYSVKNTKCHKKWQYMLRLLHKAPGDVIEFDSGKFIIIIVIVITIIIITLYWLKYDNYAIFTTFLCSGDSKFS